VHRFTRIDPAGRIVPDAEFAHLTLAMRSGEDPGGVFDALAARGLIRLHPDEDGVRASLAATVAEASGSESERIALVADTLEQTAALNTAIRARLVAAGRVDDARVVTTRAGQRIGVGDRIATRRNDHHLGVANRTPGPSPQSARTGTLSSPATSPRPAKAEVTSPPPQGAAGR